MNDRKKIDDAIEEGRKQALAWVESLLDPAKKVRSGTGITTTPKPVGMNGPMAEKIERLVNDLKNN